MARSSGLFYTFFWHGHFCSGPRCCQDLIVESLDAYHSSALNTEHEYERSVICQKVFVTSLSVVLKSSPSLFLFHGLRSVPGVILVKVVWSFLPDERVYAGVLIMSVIADGHWASNNKKVINFRVPKSSCHCVHWFSLVTCCSFNTL